MADGRHINNRFGHQPDFSEILCKEEVFHRISVIVDTAVPQNVFFCVPNASGALRIVSDTLVINALTRMQQSSCGVD